MHKKKIYLGFVQLANLAFRRSAKAVGENLHFAVYNENDIWNNTGVLTK